MALSEELKKIYSSNPVDETYYDTIEVSHSMFSKTFYMVRDTDHHKWKLEDGSEVTFESYAFDIKLPEVGSHQQDLAFVFDNVSRIAMKELEAAAELMSEPITLIYRAYISTTDLPQTSPIKLMLTNIVANNHTISATATRPDLYKRTIPTGNFAYFDQRFKGLFL